jgi:hypothetical protein
LQLFARSHVRNCHEKKANHQRDENKIGHLTLRPSFSEAPSARGVFPFAAAQLTPDNEVRNLKRGE